MASQEITHVIFDFDGVIVDTEKTYSLANDLTLKTYDRSFNNTLKNGMMGRKKIEAVQWLLHQTGLSDRVTVEEYEQSYDKLLNELLPNAPLLPGAMKLVEYFHKQRIPLAICTGSNTEEFELKSRNIRLLLDNFDFCVLSGDDPEVKSGKPAPDAYIVTMKRFASPPKTAANVLVFEDSINGVRSALAAGCQVVFVPQDEFKTHDWEERIADIKPLVAETLTSLEEFKPEQYGFSPF